MFVLVMLAQIIAFAIADQIGLFGIKVQPISILKVVAILIIAAGTGALYYANQQSEHNFAHHLKKG